MRYNRTDNTPEKDEVRRLVMSIPRLHDTISRLEKRIDELTERLDEASKRISDTEADLKSALNRLSLLEAEKESRQKAEAEAKNLFTGPTGILGRMGHMIADGLAGMPATRFAGIYALPVANKLSAMPTTETGAGFYTRLLSATWPVLSALTAPDFEHKAAGSPDIIPSMMRSLTEALAKAGIDVIYPDGPGAKPSLMQRTLPAGSPDVPALIRRSDNYIYAYGGTAHRL